MSDANKMRAALANRRAWYRYDASDDDERFDALARSALGHLAKRGYCA